METSYKTYFYVCKVLRGRGVLRGKIGHHKIGTSAEIGQNRIRGGWGVKKTHKTSDIIYVRSLNTLLEKQKTLRHIKLLSLIAS